MACRAQKGFSAARVFTGDGVAIKLTFKVVAKGSTNLTFSENVFRDSTFAEVGGLTWTAGTVTGI